MSRITTAAIARSATHSRPWIWARANESKPEAVNDQLKSRFLTRTFRGFVSDLGSHFSKLRPGSRALVAYRYLKTRPNDTLSHRSSDASNADETNLLHIFLHDTLKPRAHLSVAMGSCWTSARKPQQHYGCFSTSTPLCRVEMNGPTAGAVLPSPGFRITARSYAPAI